jgi:hypothetical protein
MIDVVNTMLTDIPWCNVKPPDDITQTINLSVDTSDFIIGAPNRQIVCSSTSGGVCDLITNRIDICDIISGTLRAKMIGLCTLSANQEGGKGYSPAPQVNKSMVIKDPVVPPVESCDDAGCTLSISYTGNGRGIVTASGWRNYYSKGTIISITARFYTGSKFGGWKGIDGCSTLPICQFTIKSNLAITAEFDLVN